MSETIYWPPQSNSSGSSASVPSLEFSVAHDAITAQFPNATTEIYQARLGGIAGSVVETVIVVYTDATKEFLQSAVRA